MENQKKTPKKDAKKNAKVRDLKPKKDAKGGDGPTETISLNFGRIEHKY
jgi:type VI protein secretion system component Hcp